MIQNCRIEFIRYWNQVSMLAIFPLQPACSSLKYQSIFRRWQDSQCQITRQYFDLRIDLYLCYNSEARHINPEVLKISKSAPGWWRWQQAGIGIGSGSWPGRDSDQGGVKSHPSTGLILITAAIKREYKMKQTTRCLAGHQTLFAVFMGFNSVAEVLPAC